MKRTLLTLPLALLLSLPVGWITAMLLTPLLWRLETILHIELAGHSGPSDWVIVVIWIPTTIVLFSVLRLVRRRIARTCAPRTLHGERPPTSLNDQR